MAKEHPLGRFRLYVFFPTNSDTVLILFAFWLTGPVLVRSGERGAGAHPLLLAAGNTKLLSVRHLDSSLESLHKLRIRKK